MISYRVWVRQARSVLIYCSSTAHSVAIVVVLCWCCQSEHPLQYLFQSRPCLGSPSVVAALPGGTRCWGGSSSWTGWAARCAGSGWRGSRWGSHRKRHPDRRSRIARQRTWAAPSIPSRGEVPSSSSSSCACCCWCCCCFCYWWWWWWFDCPYQWMGAWCGSARGIWRSRRKLSSPHNQQPVSSQWKNIPSVDACVHVPPWCRPEWPLAEDTYPSEPAWTSPTVDGSAGLIELVSHIHPSILSTLMWQYRCVSYLQPIEKPADAIMDDDLREWQRDRRTTKRYNSIGTASQVDSSRSPYTRIDCYWLLQRSHLYHINLGYNSHLKLREDKQTSK